MRHSNLSKALAAFFGTGMFLVCLSVNAASGYMAFLDPTQTTVETGDAASYMRVGRDWPPFHPVNPATNGIAQPTQQQKSKIKTWRTTTHLMFEFEIPDITMSATGGSTSTL